MRVRRKRRNKNALLEAVVGEAYARGLTHFNAIYSGENCVSIYKDCDDKFKRVVFVPEFDGYGATGKTSSAVREAYDSRYNGGPTEGTP